MGCPLPAGTVNQVSPVPWSRCPALAACELVERAVEVDPLRPARAAISRAKAGFSAKSGQTATAPPRRTLAAVGDEHRGVGAMLGAQALADRAPAERAVEREVVRRQLLEAPAAAVATAVLAVAVDGPLRLVLVVVDPGHEDDSLAQVERRLDRVGQPRAGRAADDRAIDDHLEPVFPAVAQLRRLVEADRPAVDPDPA